MAAGYYEDGTITVALNGTAVTGVGTAFASRVRVGDKLTRNGFSVPIIGPTTDGKAITSNTSLTLAWGFPAALSGSTYKIELLPDLTRALEAMERLAASLGNGNLESEAAIDGTGGNWLSYFTGAGTKARTAFSAVARALLGGADEAAMRSTLQVPGNVLVRVFNTTGTYTPTSGLKFCVIECQGPGGGGGGVVGAASTSRGGGGGGAGSYSRIAASAATIGASQPITVGTPGSGVSGADGTDAGNVSLGSICSALGGKGGKVNNGTGFGMPGDGGAPGVGTIAFAGGSGGQGSTANTTSVIPMSGSGGPGFFGGGGRPSISGGTAVGGVNATAPGGGGSGAAVVGAGGNEAGGGGGGGRVVITEFF